MTWQGGRQFSSMQKDGTALSFSYNDAGLRTEKTVNGSTRRYIWNSSQLMADVGASDAFYFHYSSGGELIGYTYKTADAETECILVKNQQGDVERVISADGTILASYTYDAWGNVLTAEGTLAAANPIRYRGYYFDAETGLYYLQSRYYDPAVGRFINADNYATTYKTSTGANMFAYCLNNPANCKDDGGELANWLVGGVIGAVIGGLSALAAGESFAAGALQGAVSGALAGAAVDVALAVIAVPGAGILAAGLLAFGGGMGGSIVGEEVHSIVTTGKTKPVDSGMIKRSLAAGATNVVSLGFSAGLQYADKGIDAFNQSPKLTEIAKRAVKNLKSIGKKSVEATDVASAFATTHFSIWGTLSSLFFPSKGKR